MNFNITVLDIPKLQKLKKEIKSFCEGYEGAKGGSPRARVGG
jgi:hypothetical protein